MLCGGFSAEVRAKKMRQDGCTEFISVSLVLIICGKLRLLLDLWINARMQIRRPCEHTSNLLTSYCILFSLYDDVGANAINGTQKEAVAYPPIGSLRSPLPPLAVNVNQSHIAGARVLGTFSHTTCFRISCAPLGACFFDRSATGEANIPLS